MAANKSHGGSSRATRELNCAEWVESVSDEVALNRLVVHGVLPNRATTAWHLAASESFPTPSGDELVVFEDYFF
jgi:hypothetical protein